MSSEDNEAAMQSVALATDGPSGTPGPADEHREWMALVAGNHDRAAFRLLFEYFGPRIKSLMLKAGAEGALAEDLVQDVMMTVWRKARLYAPDRGTVSTWVFTIARNARIDRLRRASSAPYQDVEDLEIASDEVPNDDRVDASMKAERIAAAVTGLPQEQKQIIELAFMLDKPQSEIATELGIPLGTVKSRMRLAYGKLKESLEDLR